MTLTPRIDNIEKNAVRNLVINGAFDLWQRGTSFVGADSYTTDRFRYISSAVAVVDINQSTDVPTLAESDYLSEFSMFLNVTTSTVPAAPDTYRFDYRMEGLDAAPLIGKTVLVSFWVKATKTGIYSFALQNALLTKNYISEYTVEQSDTWERKKFKILVEDVSWTLDNTLSMILKFPLASGADRKTANLDQWIDEGNKEASINSVNGVDQINNEFRLAQVTMTAVEDDFDEVNIDVPFQRAGKNFGEELRFAHRYFWRSMPPIGSPVSISITGHAYAATTGTFHGMVPEIMRTKNPTFSFNDAANLAVHAPGQQFLAGGLNALTFQSNRGDMRVSKRWYLDWTYSLGGQVSDRMYILEANTGSTAFIQFDAEL